MQENETPSLYHQLKEYSKSSAYPFHMPGHKRNASPWEEEETGILKETLKYDITEIDDFDDLHHADGIIKQAMDEAAQLYHSEHTFFLVNGSTCGILAGISAALPRNKKILMMRCSHKSAYHAVMLRDLQPVYLYSSMDPELFLDLGITLEQVKAAIENDSSIGAVFITSPTYEGITLPVREIAEYLHGKGIPLIVDAAHGAHFGMADFLPENAVTAGADIVIHSIHKTLPAPTQTALLHVNGNLISAEQVCHFLDVYETSSPSYLLMGAMQQCIRYMKQDRRQEWQHFYELRLQLNEEIKELKHIGIRDYFSTNHAMEIGKMVVFVKQSCPTDQKNGKWLYRQLREQFHLQPEFALPGYVLLFFTLFDTEEGFRRLAEALRAIDRQMDELYCADDLNNWSAENKSIQQNKETQENAEARTLKYFEGDKIQAANCMPVNFVRNQMISMAAADDMEKIQVPLPESVGKVSGGFVMVYPPGQPIVTPGEEITADVRKEIQRYQQADFDVRGIVNGKISIIKS